MWHLLLFLYCTFQFKSSMVNKTLSFTQTRPMLLITSTNMDYYTKLNVWNFYHTHMFNKLEQNKHAQGIYSNNPTYYSTSSQLSALIYTEIYWSNFNNYKANDRPNHFSGRANSYHFWYTFSTLHLAKIINLFVLIKDQISFLWIMKALITRTMNTKLVKLNHKISKIITVLITKT